MGSSFSPAPLTFWSGYTILPYALTSQDRVVKHNGKEELCPGPGSNTLWFETSRVKTERVLALGQWR